MSGEVVEFPLARNDNWTDEQWDMDLADLGSRLVDALLKDQIGPHNIPVTLSIDDIDQLLALIHGHLSDDDGA